MEDKTYIPSWTPQEVIFGAQIDPNPVGIEPPKSMIPLRVVFDDSEALASIGIGRRLTEYQYFTIIGDPDAQPSAYQTLDTFGLSIWKYPAARIIEKKLGFTHYYNMGYKFKVDRYRLAWTNRNTGEEYILNLNTDDSFMRHKSHFMAMAHRHEIHKGEAENWQLRVFFRFDPVTPGMQLQPIVL